MATRKKKQNTNDTVTKEEEVKEEVKMLPAKKEKKPLEPRIHYKEFLYDKGLSPERQAGFLASCEGKEFMRKSEWEEKYKQYIK